MPIVPNYMNQANAQNWAEGLGSVVQALNNPQAFANADLLRAKKAEIESSIAYQQGKLGLERQTTAAQLPVFAAQANNQNSQAAEHNAQARNADLVGQQLQLQTKAMMGLGSRLKATGMADADAELAQDVVISGSTKSTSENNADAINKIGRRDPLSVGNNVFWGVNDPRKPQPDVDSGASSLFPQAQGSFSQGGGLGTVLQRGPSGPVTRGNVTTIPASGSIGKSLTPAQKAVDESFGKEYTDTISRGEQFDVGKQLAQLEFAKHNLQNPSGVGVSGPIIGMMPDFVNKWVAPQAVTTRQAVEETVQRNLRNILGAQFTEKEGERLIQRSYDPGLSEAENLRRLNLLSDQIKSALASKQAAMKYYEANGTLDGWQGSLPSTTDFNPSASPAPKIGRPPLSQFKK